MFPYNDENILSLVVVMKIMINKYDEGIIFTPASAIRACKVISTSSAPTKTFPKLIIATIETDFEDLRIVTCMVMMCDNDGSCV